MNDMEKVAQRLEELSVELDNDEILGLAEVLNQWEPPMPPALAVNTNGVLTASSMTFTVSG